MNIKRYLIYPNINEKTHWWLKDSLEDIFLTIEESKKGMWVKWEDIKHLIRRENE